jgi:hypothetical protein
MTSTAMGHSCNSNADDARISFWYPYDILSYLRAHPGAAAADSVSISRVGEIVVIPDLSPGMLRLRKLSLRCLHAVRQWLALPKARAVRGMRSEPPTFWI